MQRSESIEKLALALNKFQSEMTAVKKDSVNPFFKSKYADLNGIWEAIRKPLTSNGLSVAQTISASEFGTALETTLLHISGQFISGQQPIIATKADAQSMGSAISYCRRYSLSALLGLTADDDDGHAASDPIRTGASKNEPPQKSPKELAIESHLSRQGIPEVLWQKIIDRMVGKTGKDLPAIIADVQGHV